MSADVLNHASLADAEKDLSSCTGVVRKSQNGSSFTEVPLSTSKKEPKRIVHFCDGVLEEYSTEEEEEADSADKLALVDPKTLSWLPYMLYLGYWLGAKTLSVCDYLGENLAHFFGITTPKYQYEIEEYQRILQEEEEALQKQEEERAAGWLASGATSTTASTEQLTNVQVEPSPFHITFKKVPASSAETVPDLNGQQLCSSDIRWERF